MATVGLMDVVFSWDTTVPTAKGKWAAILPQLPEAITKADPQKANPLDS